MRDAHKGRRAQESVGLMRGAADFADGDDEQDDEQGERPEKPFYREKEQSHGKDKRNGQPGQTCE